MTQENKKLLLYIVIGYIFSVALRYIWVYQFSGYAPFMHHGTFMINTNDGYFWAEGARDILAGFHQPHDLSSVDFAPAQLTAFLAHIIPVSFETLIFYMPVYLSALIVIPIMLIAKRLHNLEMGLITALLSGIAWSYYNRTMAGYYDTDMLNIVLPMFLLWSIIWAIDTKKNIYLLLSAFDILVYRWWYPQSYSLEFSFFAMILLYTLVFERKTLYNYKLLAIMLFAMMGLDGYIRLALVVVAYALFLSEKFEKYTFHILGFSLVSFFVTGGFEPIWFRLKLYVFPTSVSQVQGDINLHFYTVMQTVREAGHIPFETFANRISGHMATFIVSLVGYGYLLYRHKIMIFSLPLVGLGFLASFAGLRFTIYAIIPLAFGLAYLITQLANKYQDKKIRYGSMGLITLAVLLPNIIHIVQYRVPTVFDAQEVQVLEQLKKEAQREDYVVAWWDYGYPIRYYADVKTLVDGAKHIGEVNFPVSFILTHDQKTAALMARLDVEFEEKNFNNPQKGSIVEQMMRHYGFNDANDFLFALENDDITLPKKTRDIYLYLPYRMLDIYSTVALFSNIDLMSGKQRKTPFFYVSHNFMDKGAIIDLGHNIFLDKQQSVIRLGANKVPIKRFVKTEYDATGKLHVDEQLTGYADGLNVIYMGNYHTFVLADDQTYNSTYIQLFVLQHYDKSLYQEVISTPTVKVYKLKI